ncbi:lectin like domain-containing protein [Methanobacterium sp. BAmetb5]|uniref:lectin like domain-containing protein n=1 Tax=Methanobacterium sp. BAmetb5 TaxID=2025351 RepID=UPI000E83FD15|nr:lectin like domain-containing protein [Methanobacterium sp. BAmetb5]AXV39104.1 MAG: hypothetical protein CIT02_01625 [Methanobacterium sp. BAmetb5]
MFNKIKIVSLVFLLVFASSGFSFGQDNNLTHSNTSFEYNFTNNSSISTNNSSNYTSTGINALEDSSLGADDNNDFSNPIKFEYLKGVLIFSPEELENLPSYYDLRLLGRLTPIKDQNPLGTCWVFSTLGSLESSLLPYESWNFSENNVKNILSYSYPEGFDRTFTGGGDWLAVLAYLARYSGPVLAVGDPYNTTSDYSPSGLTPVKHVQGNVIIPPRVNSSDNAQYKLAIMKYGAVVTQMAVYSDFYNDSSAAYYCDEPAAPINHDICLVGWDDNYDRNNFLTPPPGDGAFIVRNSWGTGWGDGGYFYMSYYDTRLATQGGCAFSNIENTTNYNQVYQYDPYGLVNMTGFTCQTAWFSNVFTANTTNPLKAASFYSLAPNSTYNVSIYLNPENGDPKSGVLAYWKNGVIDTPGYKTIPFDSYIPLNLGQIFSVVVKITSPGILSPVAYEYPLGNYSSRANASFGEGFISSDGVTWLDMAGFVTNASVCLKAFTVSAAGLVLSQESDNDNPKLGDPIKLTIKLFNQGPDTVSGVTVYDKLPPGLSFISYWASFGTYDPASGLWNIGGLPYNQTAILIINAIASQLGSFTNMVTVNSLTYNPLTSTGVLSVHITPNDGLVNAVTIPLQNTGLPIAPVIIGFLLILGGIYLPKRS